MPSPYDDPEQVDAWLADDIAAEAYAAADYAADAQTEEFEL